MQPARTNQRRAKMACNAPIRPLYTFLVTFASVNETWPHSAGE
jgi:hypothetical protein